MTCVSSWASPACWTGATGSRALTGHHRSCCWWARGMGGGGTSRRCQKGVGAVVGGGTGGRGGAVGLGVTTIIEKGPRKVRLMCMKLCAVNMYESDKVLYTRHEQ